MRSPLWGGRGRRPGRATPSTASTPPYLCNYLDHVEALLGFNGYEKNIGGEIFFAAPNYTSVEPVSVAMNFTIHLEWHEDLGKRLYLVMQAVRDDGKIGSCHSLSCAAFAHDSTLEN